MFLLLWKFFLMLRDSELIFVGCLKYGKFLFFLNIVIGFVFNAGFVCVYLILLFWEELLIFLYECFILKLLINYILCVWFVYYVYMCVENESR